MIMQKVKDFGRKLAAGAALVAASGAAMAQSAGGSGVDHTQILASVEDAQTKGVAIAGAVTLMIFAFAAAKWLRRAK